MSKTGYLSTVEVSRLLRCSRVYAWRLISTGRIRGEKIGKQWFALHIDVETYLMRQAAKQMRALK